MFLCALISTRLAKTSAEPKVEMFVQPKDNLSENAHLFYHAPHDHYRHSHRKS
jgi:hypothetical protein